MNPNEATEQKRVVVDSPGVRREIVTETTQRGPTESGLSTGMIALIAILAIVAIGIVVYIVSNRNANESANRNANIDVASQASSPQAPATTIIQQPAAPPQQAPVIIQQPAPAQQAPIIIQQPAAAAENGNSKDDSAMQAAAAKILIEDPDMGSVSVSIGGARAVLTGAANSEATKERAEHLVKTVRGVKSVENKIFVSGE